jgi:hypothetical protein
MNNSNSSVSSIGIKKSPELTVNLYVLFSAYFSNGNYPESLRFISFIIAFFQQKGAFNRVNTPRLDPEIDKLIFEMASISPEQLNNVWGCLGAKYMPSVIYKVRMLTYNNNIIREIRPLVSGVESDNNIANT